MGTLVVAVSPEVAPALTDPQGSGSAEAAGLLARVAELGGTLRPQHPGVGDAALARWFVVDDVADADAERVAAAIRELPAVDGAYVKPSEEAP